jgi:4-hydroxyphenylpyruvate dioxygenase
LFGSGVQHIALSMADIRRTVARMIGNGVEMLPIPDNDPDDLEARTELSSADIDELKVLNILYDRDAGGEFYQA